MKDDLLSNTLHWWQLGNIQGTFPTEFDVTHMILRRRCGVLPIDRFVWPKPESESSAAWVGLGSYELSSRSWLISCISVDSVLHGVASHWSITHHG